MSPSFVKFTPDIEAADPGFDENLRIVIGRTERYIAQSVTTEGTGRAVRDAHASRSSPRQYGPQHDRPPRLGNLCKNQLQ
jgi:hypothetical protein